MNTAILKNFYVIILDIKINDKRSNIVYIVVHRVSSTNHWTANLMTAGEVQFNSACHLSQYVKLFNIKLRTFLLLLSIEILYIRKM